MLIEPAAGSKSLGGAASLALHTATLVKAGRFVLCFVHRRRARSVINVGFLLFVAGPFIAHRAVATACQLHRATLGIVFALVFIVVGLAATSSLAMRLTRWIAEIVNRNSRHDRSSLRCNETTDTQL